MLSGPLAFGNERIGRLLHAVVQEPIGPCLPEHQPCPYGLQERSIRHGLARAIDHAQGGDRRAVAQAGELSQCRLGRFGQTGQLAKHEVHDIVGEALGLDLLKIPRPAHLAMVEGEQALLGERGEELDGEERVAGGLLVDKLG